MVQVTDIDEVRPPFPVRLTMEYPERLGRLSTAFRIILAIPVIIFVALLGGGEFSGGWGSGDGGENARNAGAGVAGALLLAIWATIILRERIPRWLFDFQVWVHRFTYRAYSYIALLTDRYPAFEAEYPLRYEVDYPDRVSRWRVFFWKLITSIPHFVVLFFLVIASFFVVFIAWWIILFTGTFPRGLHTFVVGVMRWGARVTAYFESLTDAFPPYSMDDDAGPGSGSAQAVSAVIGGVILAAIIAGAVGLIVFLVIYLNDSKRVDVDYQDAIGGALSGDAATVELDDVTYTLAGGSDPAALDLVVARPGFRLVEFRLEYVSDEDRANVEFGGRPEDIGRERIEDDAVRLETEDEGEVEPVLLTFEGQVAPLRVDEGASGELRAIFEVENGDEITELRAYPNHGNERHVVWEFE